LPLSFHFKFFVKNTIKPIKPTKANMTITLFHHQKEALAWMKMREAKPLVLSNGDRVCGGLLCDEMGLGKTYTTMALIAADSGSAKQQQEQTLIVAPLPLLDNWIAASRSFGIEPYVFNSKKSAWTAERPVKTTQVEIYITNYHSVMNRGEGLAIGPEGTSWTRVVCDEAHMLRTIKGSFAQALRAVKGERRWCLTATPIVNTENDLASLFCFLGMLAGEPKKSWRSWMEPLIGDLCFGRTCDQLRARLSEIPPPPIYEPHYLDFRTKEEAAFYRVIQQDVSQFMTKYKRFSLSAMKKIAMLLRLRQVSIHPQVYINSMKAKEKKPMANWQGSSTKFDALVDIVRADQEPSSYLIFCQFHDEMTLLEKHLREKGLFNEIFQFHGGMSAAERSAIIVEAKKAAAVKTPINGKKPAVMLIQIHSGGVGLNLQEFDCCVFMSSWWTSALMDQAVARASRIGRKGAVRVIQLLLNEEKAKINIDTLMGAKVDFKRELHKWFVEKMDSGSSPRDPTPEEQKPKKIKLVLKRKDK
jgi:SNF2 family DNA or RNA helicase